ncbi:MAG: tRNA (adenosine(37)-N6)-threonylcarbamoyltransferase complex ATPase subunit type 1 TsaE [Candidatus Gracilibacteria bacterium]
MPVSKSEKETHRHAKKVAASLKKGGILCLYGELGSGKTTFVKGLASALGLDNFIIKSPTYTYIRHYPLKNQNFYHIDLYRLEEIDQLLACELEELLENPKNILVIEWADRLKKALPQKRTDIFLEYVDDHSRKITIQKISRS